MEKWLIDALKAYPCAELEGGIYRTCPVRLSFPAVFKAVQGDDPSKKPKFGITCLFPLGADISLLRQAVAKMTAEKFPGHKGALHKPFRDQGEKGHIEGYVEGAFFIAANTEKKPQVRKAVNGKLVPIQDEDDIYPGCWALVTLHPYKFVTDKKQGITFGLNNVMKIRDDERFGGGGSDPENDFAGAAVDLNDGAAINADDLM